MEIARMELNAAPAPADSSIKDVTEASFMADVIDASMEAPVVVDFWAPWCGPCKTLGPALEAAVRATKGKVHMAKIDVDQNQRIAAQMRVQSIPAVFAFFKGQPVDGFMGAQTPAQIKAFIDRLVETSGGNDGLEEAIAMAEEMLAEGAAEDAAQTFSAILAEEVGNVAALGGLARAYLALGDVEQARATLDLAPKEKANDAAILAARAQIELAGTGADAGEVAELTARVERDPADLQARFDLAGALIAKGDPEGAIAQLLELFRRDREWNDGAAKARLFTLFDSLGPKDPAVLKGRRGLSSMIFA
jgi:putative thioredoxin